MSALDDILPKYGKRDDIEQAIYECWDNGYGDVAELAAAKLAQLRKDKADAVNMLKLAVNIIAHVRDWSYLDTLDIDAIKGAIARMEDTE